DQKNGTNSFGSPLLRSTLQNLKNSAETETGENLKAQGQGYMVDAPGPPSRTLLIFAEWLKMCVV
ncbi:hypothetical protein, partial [Proteus faecis]|uniref:hypothetical protein n=1 Tax=Proteus faecis TaxID=2050967 RepID=UPI00301C89E6